MEAKSPIRRILFVCMGNICRSPTGEGVMKKVICDRGLQSQIQVDSAGTIAFHVGNRPDLRMRRAASNRGYQLDSVARQFHSNDFEQFDLIIAMDRRNMEDLRIVKNAKKYAYKIRKLGSFLPGAGEPDVPDPYYGQAGGFDQVLDMIEQACPHILDHLLTQTSR